MEQEQKTMMDMLRELEKAIEGERRNQVGAHVIKTDALFKQCIKLASLPVEGDGWISVEDQPYPPDRRCVIVYCPERRNMYACTMDIRKSSKWHIFGPGHDELYEEVSHWMPLPSPPKSTTDNTEKR